MSKLDSIIDSILSVGTTPRAVTEKAEQDAEQNARGARSIPHVTSVASNPHRAKRSSAPPDTGRFPLPASEPTQSAAHGVLFDFNLGPRVHLPAGRWHVRITDEERHAAFFDGEADDGLVTAPFRYYFPCKIVVRSVETNEAVLTHRLDFRAQNVTIHLGPDTLGTPIGWFAAAAAFAEQHLCTLTVVMDAPYCELFRAAYPSINCVDPVHYERLKSAAYATYYIGVFTQDDARFWQPSDYRLVGVHRAASDILGLPPCIYPPRLTKRDPSPPACKHPFVVISSQASFQCQAWNHPSGWLEVIRHLDKLGYESVCIDDFPIWGQGNHWNHIPHGCVDETRERSLVEKARWLQDAAFFIGLSSELAWLAWALRLPVILISGFTHPLNEFEAAHRVSNPFACHNCWHDTRHLFDRDDFLFCPRHEDIHTKFECTKSITPAYVTACIDQVHAACAAKVTSSKRFEAK